MENKANYALVGALSLALVVALFGFVYWFAGPASSVAVKPYDVVFTGEVSGVRTGTDVLFNGVQVGQVRGVTLDPNDSGRVIVRIEVAESTPVRADTKTVLGFQGLTGLGSLQLSGGTAAAGEPQPAPGLTNPTLYADTSNFQSILDGVASTVTGANTAVERLNAFLDTNATKLDSTITDVQSFSAALAANSPGLERFLSGVADAGEQIGPMADEIRNLSQDLRALVNAVPAEQVTRVVGDVSTFTDSLARNADQIDAFFATTQTLSADLNDITTRLRSSAAAVEAVTAEIDPEAVGRAVDNLDSFAQTLSSNSENFDTIVSNVTTMSQSLSASSGQVTQVISDVGTFGASLARNADQVDSFFSATSTLSGDLETITTSLKTSATAIEAIMAEVDPTAVGTAIDDVSRFANRLGDNSDNVDAIMTNARELTASLNASSAQVDSILTRIDNLVGDADGQGMFDDISEAAQSVRVLADQLNAATSQIARGLNDFTSRGLSEYTSLAVDARSTLQRLDNVVRSIEQNPQSLVFGGQTVRDYTKQ